MDKKKTECQKVFNFLRTQIYNLMLRDVVNMPLLLLKKIHIQYEHDST